MATKIKGGGARKYDRNRVWCKAYAADGRAERSKARRIIKHLSKAPWDGCARAAFEKLSVTAKKGLFLPPLAHSPVWERHMNGTTLAETKRALRAA